MKRKNTILLLGALFAVTLFSCKKSSHTAQTCQLTAITDSTTTLAATTQMTYDNDARLASVVVSGANGCKRTFQYIGARTIIFSVSDTTPGIRTEIDTITLNSAGLALTQAGYFPTSGEKSLETFFYNDAGISTGSTESENGVPGDTVLYNTVNGDLIYDQVKGQTAHKDDFTYYPSQAIVYGDPTDFRQLLYVGAYYYKNKHMLNELYSPTSYKGYSYTFDDNRIKQVVLRQWTALSADTVVHRLNYSYTCK